jgi:hypothetical protein
VDEETYRQTLYLGDQIDVEAEDCCLLSEVLFVAAGATNKIRITVSVGTGPLRLKSMKSKAGG